MLKASTASQCGQHVEAAEFERQAHELQDALAGLPRSPDEPECA
jgi:hypothetical protein